MVYLFYIEKFLAEQGIHLNGEQLCCDGTHIHQRPTACWRIVACGMVQRNNKAARQIKAWKLGEVSFASFWLMIVEECIIYYIDIILLLSRLYIS